MDRVQNAVQNLLDLYAPREIVEAVTQIRNSELSKNFACDLDERLYLMDKHTFQSTRVDHMAKGLDL